MSDSPSNSPRPARVIAIAVVERTGDFLIGQRPSSVPLAGLWEFPGGKVQPGESPSEAAIRECLEETGLSVEVTGEYRVDEQDYAHDRVQLHFFACHLLSDNVSPLTPFRWVRRAELRDYEFPEGNRRLLELITR